jgi:4'-phosphopantetheinyl transferase
MFASGNSLPTEWPGTHTSQLDGEVHVWPVELRARQRLIGQALSLLSEEEKARATRLKTPQDRNCFVLSRCILRVLLSHFLGQRPERLEITHSQYGKPCLADQSSRIRFNLCHSGQIAAYAVSMDCEVGVDVERVRPVPEMEEIAKRFFSPAERQELSNLNWRQRTRGFFSCWVRKEAYVKALGGGLSIPLNSFQVIVTPGPASPIVSVRADVEEAGKWRIQDFSPAPGYLGAIAFNDHKRPVFMHANSHAAGVLHWLADGW